jgi:hypothetical protein
MADLMELDILGQVVLFVSVIRSVSRLVSER